MKDLEHGLQNIELHGKGQQWAIIAGVDTYEDKNYYGHLTVSTHDAKAIYTLLLRNNFDKDHIHLLTDQGPHPPSKGNILATLQSVARVTEPEDLLLFYFSGHGEEKDGESYLVPTEGRGIVLEDMGIPIKRVREIMEKAEAKAKVIILDACHSGAKIGSKGTRPMSAEFIQHTFEEAAGIAILSSCTQGQLSYEWPDQNCSAFTYYLLDALQGSADHDEKGFVTVQDVSHHVTAGVKIWASQQQLIQTPTLNYLVIGDIILTRYSGQSIAASPGLQDAPTTTILNVDDATSSGEGPVLDESINRYVGDLKALREGRVHQELTDRLAATGAIKPGPPRQTGPEDILERYLSVPLHAVFLYTSEDPEVHTYISENWKALDALTNNNCDFYPIMTQYNNSGDGYDFMEQLDPVRLSQVRPAYSDLPGIFFWDNFGDSAYISFGPQVSHPTIRNILRVMFEEVRREPTLAAVMRASALLAANGRSTLEGNPRRLEDGKDGRDGRAVHEGNGPRSGGAGSRTTAFIAYDPKDKRYLEELRAHLAYYERQGSLTIWDDSMILPGALREEEIRKAIQSAKVVILLLSSHFLNSDFMIKDLPPLLRAMENKEVTLLPVIVRRCMLEDTPLAPFQPVNPGIPLATMKSSDKRDDIWIKVAQRVKRELIGK